jgi:hypothetical protein
MKTQLQGFGVTLRTSEQSDHGFVSVTPRDDMYPEILRMRIEKLPGGEIKGPQRDPYSPIIKFFFSEKELRIEQEGTINPYLPLNPYTNKAKLNPLTMFTIPVELLKAKVYDLSYHTDYRGDFIILSGKFKHGSHIVVINVWALTLFDAISEIKMTGELFFQFVSIGTVAIPNAFLPFYWTQIVNLGREDQVVEEFINSSRSLALDLVGRDNYTTLSAFRHIAWAMERNGKSEKEGLRDAKQVFVKLFST